MDNYTVAVDVGVFQVMNNAVDSTAKAPKHVYMPCMFHATVPVSKHESITGVVLLEPGS